MSSIDRAQHSAGQHLLMPILLVAIRLRAPHLHGHVRSSCALVHLNDKEIGRTPTTTGFLFYGVYDVRLEIEGHQTLQTSGTAAAPWWDNLGLDLIAETGNPHVDVRWHYKLEPSTEDQDTEGLLDRAQQLRTDLNADPPVQK